MTKNKIISSLLFSCFGIIVSLIAYPFISEHIIVHWSETNTLNLTKFPYLFVVPLISILITLIIIFLSYFDKIEKSSRHEINVYFTLAVFFGFVANLTQIFLISAQFGFRISFNFIFYLSVGMLISFIGNYLPKLRPSRISFLLRKLFTANPKEALKSLRIRGYSLFISGIMIMLCSLLDNFVGASFAVVTSISILVITLLINYVYTYMKTLKGGAPNER